MKTFITVLALTLVLVACINSSAPVTTVDSTVVDSVKVDTTAVDSNTTVILPTTK